MELDTSHPLAFTVITIEIVPSLHGGRVDFAISCSFVITEHFEIVLEHINDFVGLECCFNTICNSVNELIKLLSEYLCLLDLFF